MCSTKIMRHRRYRTIAPLCLAGFLLAACSSDYVNRDDKISLDVGDAVAHNKAVHIIDPWPHHAERTAADTDSTRMIVAIEKYEKGPDKSSSAGKAPTTITN